MGVHQVMECGKDPQGLGRWAWTRYRGWQGVNICVVVAYRPVLNKSGSLSVWNQQTSIFKGIKGDWCLKDLCREVSQWLESSDQLVVGLDVNDDVRNCQ